MSFVPHLRLSLSAAPVRPQSQEATVEGPTSPMRCVPRPSQPNLLRYCTVYHVPVRGVSRVRGLSLSVEAILQYTFKANYALQEDRKRSFFAYIYLLYRTFVRYGW